MPRLLLNCNAVCIPKTLPCHTAICRSAISFVMPLDANHSAVSHFGPQMRDRFFGSYPPKGLDDDYYCRLFDHCIKYDNE